MPLRPSRSLTLTKTDDVRTASLGAEVPRKGGTVADVAAKIIAGALSHPKNPKYINCCLIGIIRNNFKSLEEKI
jgi:hypothetical protein